MGVAKVGVKSNGREEICSEGFCGGGARCPRWRSLELNGTSAERLSICVPVSEELVSYWGWRRLGLNQTGTGGPRSWGFSEGALDIGVGEGYG